MKIFNLIFALFFIPSAMILFADENSLLSKAVKEMKVGEWKKLETTGFDRELLYSSGKTILPYANKAAWDPKTETVSFIGMCHMTPPMKHIQYNAKENNWVVLPPEEWYKANVWFHAYDNSTAGSGFFYHNFWGSRVWQFDIAKKEWFELPKVLANGSHGASLSYFPEMGKSGSLIHLFGSNGIQIYDIETKKWKMFEKKAKEIGPYHNVSAYNAKRKSVILGGGNGCKILYELDATGNFTELKPAPIAIGVNSSTFVIDPASGDLIVYDYQKSQKIYSFDLSDKNAEWVEKGVSEIFSKYKSNSAVVSIDSYGVTMWFNDSGVFLYKHK